MKTLELNQMENLQGESCGSAILFGAAGIIIMGLSTAAAPVISGWTVLAIVNISVGIGVACA